jgi:hypothetical protein
MKHPKFSETYSNSLNSTKHMIFILITKLKMLKILQTLIHYSLHFLFPGLIAYTFFRALWQKAWLIMLATMLVDLDHLLANPIFDPNRCSIGYHPLHSKIAIIIYVLMFFYKPLTIIAIGLLLHMLTDYQDCLWMRFF